MRRHASIGLGPSGLHPLDDTFALEGVTGLVTQAKQGLQNITGVFAQ